ncbi:MAG: hypothetical protein H6631_03490 [Anaerolineaceae bacterium]|nr:hypothetical protein [Anaerolineaceae bacterium]
MHTLIQKTFTSFRDRNGDYQKNGYMIERDIFNEILSARTAENLDTSEDRLFQECRRIIKQALVEGRKRNLEIAYVCMEEVETALHLNPISDQCRLLIITFRNGALAYLKYLDAAPDEGKALLLDALAIDNYLIQEHDYWVLEMHRVQLMQNLVRIDKIFGNKEEAIRQIFYLIQCFAEHSLFPACYLFTDPAPFREIYRARIAERMATSGPAGDLSVVYTTPVTRFSPPAARFGEMREETLLDNHLRTRFLLDFSALSFPLIERMYNQQVTELAMLARGKNYPELRALFGAYGFHTISDLKPFRPYRMGYLWFTIKLHAIHGEAHSLLEAVEALCEIEAYPPLWESAAVDFYHFCRSSEQLEPDLKHRICNTIEANFEVEKF